MPPLASKAAGAAPTASAVPKTAAPAPAATSKAAAQPPGSARGGSRGPEIVWYPHANKDEWSPCQLISRDPGGGASLKIQRQSVALSPEEAQLIRPGGPEVPADLSALRREGLGAAHVEEALRSRFCSELPYSSIGDVTLCVNPYRELPIHDASWVEKYAAADSSLPPHIYGTAARAKKASALQDQTLLLLGEPGSGKSRALEDLLHFLVQTGGKGDEEEPLLGLLPEVLRPLLSVRCGEGKAAWSSTRALVSLDVGLAADGSLAGAAVKVEMLDAGRAARGASTGALFEALYLASQEGGAAAWLAGHAGPAARDGDLEDLELWTEALQAFGLDAADLARVLCGLLLLGDGGALGAAAASFGVSEESLASELPAGREAQPIVAALYERLVAWVVQRANSKLGRCPGHRVRLVELPSLLEDGDSRADCLHRLGLQWLAEVAQAELLSSSRSGNLEDLSDAAARSAAALAALEQLAVVLEQEGNGLGGQEHFSKWLGQQDADTVSRNGQGNFQVHGASGSRSYAASDLLAARAQQRQASKVLELLGKSTCPVVAEIFSLPAPPSGLPAVGAAAAAVRAAFRGEGGQRPWLVCCLRPNDVCSSQVASRAALLRQVEAFRLEDMVQLEHDTAHVWSLQGFRRTYDRLAQGSARSDDFQVCRRIVSSAGAGHGSVGQRHVYGSAALRKALDGKLQEQRQAAASRPADALRPQRPPRPQAELRDEPQRPLPPEAEQRRQRPRPFPPMMPATTDDGGASSRSMVEGRHAALHAKLSQMAAVIRVAKEREVRILRERGPLTEEVELLRQERDAWRSEADRLWRQVQDLQRRLLE